MDSILLGLAVVGVLDTLLRLIPFPVPFWVQRFSMLAATALGALALPGPFVLVWLGAFGVSVFLPALVQTINPKPVTTRPRRANMRPAHPKTGQRMPDLP